MAIETEDVPALTTHSAKDAVEHTTSVRAPAHLYGAENLQKDKTPHPF